MLLTGASESSRLELWLVATDSREAYHSGNDTSCSCTEQCFKMASRIPAMMRLNGTGRGLTTGKTRESCAESGGENATSTTGLLVKI